MINTVVFLLVFSNINKHITYITETFFLFISKLFFLLLVSRSSLVFDILKVINASLGSAAVSVLSLAVFIERTVLKRCWNSWGNERGKFFSLWCRSLCVWTKRRFSALCNCSAHQTINKNILTCFNVNEQRNDDGYGDVVSGNKRLWYC